MIKHKRKLTVEESIILDVWYQYSNYSLDNKRKFNNGLSVIKSCESYLKEHKIINSWGNKRPEIIWE